jgi:hypothetical protein
MFCFRSGFQYGLEEQRDRGLSVLARTSRLVQIRHNLLDFRIEVGLIVRCPKAGHQSEAEDEPDDESCFFHRDLLI